MISGLLLHRARRRQAESELRENQEFMELSTSAGELGLWVRDLERGDLWANPHLRSLFGFGQNDVVRFEDMSAAFIPTTGPESCRRCSARMRKGSPLKENFAWFLPDGGERWIAARGRTADERKPQRRAQDGRYA